MLVRASDGGERGHQRNSDLAETGARARRATRRNMTGPLAPIAIAGTAHVKGLVGEEQSVDAFYARLQDDIASGKDPKSNVARIEKYDFDGGSMAVAPAGLWPNAAVGA
jgi:hypothetical protein